MMVTASTPLDMDNIMVSSTIDAVTISGTTNPIDMETINPIVSAGNKNSRTVDGFQHSGKGDSLRRNL